MRRKTWDTGNLFAIPLSDGSYALGQVIGREARVLNSITCGFFSSRISERDLGSVNTVPPEHDLISVQFTTKDLLTRRVWRVLGNYPVSLDQSLFPNEARRAGGWVGATVIGSGIMASFLAAFFGLEPWNQMHDPSYFDHLLLRPELKPRVVRLVN